MEHKEKTHSAELAAVGNDTTVVPAPPAPHADPLQPVADALLRKMADGPGYGIEGPHAAHTPGPWEAQNHLGNSNIYRVMPVFKRTNVGRLPPWEGSGFYIKNAADAHLIAAAPDYWDAAEMMSTDAGELEGDDAGYVAVTKESYDALMAAHRKALAKAEGR